MKIPPFVFFSLVCLAVNAYARPLNVVATITDFGAMAREVGGDKVKVTSIAKGTEDSHFVDAKPSFVRVLNQADVLIEGGAELEIGWLPPLVNGARNSRILGEAPGHVVLGRFIHLQEVPAGSIDRSMGDVHPLGNPHFWLDPENGKIIARVLADAFAKLDPADSAYFQANADAFVNRVDKKMAEWSKSLGPYRGTKVVSYHKSFDYLFNRFGFQLVGTIESRPGIEPSPAYINSLIQRLQGGGVKLVIIEPYRPHNTPEKVARALGATLLVMPEKVEGNPRVKDYLSLFDNDIAQILEGLKSSK
jgi:zinc/manganese transport system substrate-binding protein